MNHGWQLELDMKRIILLLVVVALLALGCAGNALTFEVPKQLPPATVGEHYNYSFVSPLNPNGGNPPYSFLVGTGEGSPPIGLHLDASGTLSGTPSAAGTRTFKVCVKDLSGNQACDLTSLTVNVPEVVEEQAVREPQSEDTEGEIAQNWTGEFQSSHSYRDAMGLHQQEEEGEFTFALNAYGGSILYVEGSGTATVRFMITGVCHADATFSYEFEVAGEYNEESGEIHLDFVNPSPAMFEYDSECDQSQIVTVEGHYEVGVPWLGLCSSGDKSYAGYRLKPVNNASDEKTCYFDQYKGELEDGYIKVVIFTAGTPNWLAS